MTALLARLMAPVDSGTTVGIGDAPGLSARNVTAVFGWRGPCGVVPEARSAEGLLGIIPVAVLHQALRFRIVLLEIGSHK